MSENPNSLHQFTTGEVFVALRQWLNANSAGRAVLGPVDVKLQENARLIQPDIFVLLDNNWQGDVSVFEGVPDLVVEVLSDDSYRLDRVVKYISYEQVGVKEYWIVNLKNNAVEVYALQDKEYDLIAEFIIGETVTSPLLEGFSVEVESLFPEKVVMQSNGEVSAKELGESVPA